MSNNEPDSLYELYCDYASQLRVVIPPNHWRRADSPPMSKGEFAAVWQSLSTNRREFWYRRFAAGYPAVAAAESETLNAVFANSQRTRAA